jgi:hypothetical protein
VQRFGKWRSNVEERRHIALHMTVPIGPSRAGDELEEHDLGPGPVL